MLRPAAFGRRSGWERLVILGYCEDGPKLVTPAMNGWGDDFNAYAKFRPAETAVVVLETRV